LRESDDSGLGGRANRTKPLMAFLLFLFAVTVVRAIWFGMSAGTFLIALVFYAALWAIVLGIDHYSTRR